MFILAGVVAAGFIAVLISLGLIKAKLDRQITQNETIKTLLGTLVPAEDREKIQRMIASVQQAEREAQTL